MIEFVALKTFWSPELNSAYCEGLSYCVGEGFRDLITRWNIDEKIKIEKSESKLRGKGKVS